MRLVAKLYTHNVLVQVMICYFGTNAKRIIFVRLKDIIHVCKLYLFWQWNPYALWERMINKRNCVTYVSGIRKVRLTYSHMYVGRCCLKWKRLLSKCNETEFPKCHILNSHRKLKAYEAVCIETHVHLPVLERKDVQVSLIIVSSRRRGRRSLYLENYSALSLDYHKWQCLFTEHILYSYL